MFLKRVAARLPTSWQNEMKRIRYRRQIQNDTFVTPEPEYKILHTFVGSGDWVIDIGANIGHYTKRLSDLVGPEGRVIAFEPVSETFALLAANVQFFKFTNVTLINAAASNVNALVEMNIPRFKTGLKNLYQANIDRMNSNPQGINVFTIRLDSLVFPNRISLIKIDTEGHEFNILNGMIDLIRRDHPVLIIEIGSDDVINLLKNYGYFSNKLPGSPNLLFLHYDS